MNDKKFHLPSIIISAAALILGYFIFPVEAIIAAVIGLVLAIRKRNTARIKIAVVLSVIAIIGSISSIIFFCYMSGKYGEMTDYWLFELIYGKAV